MKKVIALLTLFGFFLNAVTAQYSNEYSTCSSKDCASCFITKLENVGSYTKVTFKYASIMSAPIWIEEGGYILDKRTNTQYALRNAQNIGIGKRNKVNVPAGEILTYYLYYDQIPESATFLDIMETTQPGGFNYYNIRLNNSGIYGVYNFADGSSDFIRNNYSAIQRNKEAQAQKKETNAAIGIGVGVAAAAAAAAIAVGVTQSKAESQYYRLQITNKHTDPRNIYVAGEYIGKVPARSTTTFTLSRTKYGRIESVQASGYFFSPNRESGTINSKPGADQLITFTF